MATSPSITYLCRLNSMVGAFVQGCPQHFTEAPLLHQVSLEPGLQCLLDELLQQFHRQILLGDLAHLPQESVRHDADVGFFQRDNLDNIRDFLSLWPISSALMDPPQWARPTL